MNLNEYMEKLVNSQTDDWNAIVCWGSSCGPSYLERFTVWNTGSDEFLNLEVESQANVAVLKSDLSISIAWGLRQNDDFVEDWANKFPDPKATSSYMDFFYNGVLVCREVMVCVDGGRVYLPLPTSTTDLTVPRNLKRVIGLVNSLQTTYDYDNYFSRAGLQAVDEEWPK